MAGPEDAHTVPPPRPAWRRVLLLPLGIRRTQGQRATDAWELDRAREAWVRRGGRCAEDRGHYVAEILGANESEISPIESAVMWSNSAVRHIVGGLLVLCVGAAVAPGTA